MIIFTRAQVPDHLAKDWLQHLRDFDAKHPGCHFEVVADAPDMSIAEMTEAVRIEPGLTFTQIIERGNQAMIRIVLDEPLYRELVAGREVQVKTLGAETVALILEDIGWARMLIGIEEAMRGGLHEAIREDD